MELLNKLFLDVSFLVSDVPQQYAHWFIGRTEVVDYLWGAKVDIETMIVG